MSAYFNAEVSGRAGFASFTVRARKVLQLANQEAERLAHGQLATQHLMLGLLKESMSIAAQVLNEAGLDLFKARLEVKKAIQPSSSETTGTRPCTAAAQEVLRHAPEQARRLGHTLVGTGHVLLALIEVTRDDPDNLLLENGIRPEALQSKTLSALETVDWEAGEQFCRYDSPAESGETPAVPLPAKPTLNLVNEVIWALPISAAIGLLSWSWALFLITLGMIVLQNICRGSWSKKRGTGREGIGPGRPG
jgi:ATP-dependent Clp protease ATP-binding subunit ClpA